MDKLELDTRVARLERRLSLLAAGIVLAAGLFAGAWCIAAIRQPDLVTPATAFEIPPPVPVATPVPTQFLTVAAPMMAEGSMPALQRELAMFHGLLDEGVIREEEWEAKKGRLLSQPVTPGDLRSDLEQVQQLWTEHLICEDERDALRAQLLGIEERDEEP
jgi:hypothetical protein